MLALVEASFEALLVASLDSPLAALLEMFLEVRLDLLVLEVLLGATVQKLASRWHHCPPVLQGRLELSLQPSLQPACCVRPHQPAVKQGPSGRWPAARDAQQTVKQKDTH